MSEAQIRRYATPILEAVARGKRAAPPRRPSGPPRPTDDVLARFEALRNWRKARAQERGVESDIIVSKEALWALAHSAPRSADELARIAELGPWKTRTYGDEILRVIAGADGHPGGGRQA